MSCQRWPEYIDIVHYQGKFLCYAGMALNAANRAGDYQLSASLREEIRVILEHLACLRDEHNQHRAEKLYEVFRVSSNPHPFDFAETHPFLSPSIPAAAIYASKNCSNL
jgi:hypothetical protein